MQDRIPLYPGRVKMTPVAGQANTFDMVRADDPTQAGTPLNKATLLKDATAALYGLGTGAVPDDVFAELGKYKQYWWRRRLSAGERYVEVQSDIPNAIGLFGPYVETSQVIYSKQLTIDQNNGTAALGAALTLPKTSGQELAEAIVANAPLYVSVSGTIYCIPDGATAGAGSNPSFNNSTIMYYTSSNKDYVYINGSGSPLGKTVATEKKLIPAGDWEYLQSSNRNAYPDSGEVPISSTWVEHRENNSDTLLEYNNTYSYAAEITIDQSTGGISLVAPNTTTATDGDAERNFIKSKAPCYLTTSYSPSKIYYVPAGATSGTSYTNTLQGNGFPVEFGSAGNPHGMVVTAVQKTINYEYEYLGIPFDNAVEGMKTDTGSYVGTGTYGAANPNTLTMEFEPKFVIFWQGSIGSSVVDVSSTNPFYWIYNGDKMFPTSSTNNYNCFVTLNGTTLTWYSPRNKYAQYNDETKEYHYVAIG